MPRRDNFDPAESGYIEVPERVAQFYELYPEGRIASSPPIVVMIEGDTGKHLELLPSDDGGEAWMLVDGPDTDGGFFVRHQTYIQVTTTVWRTPDDPSPCVGSAWELYPGRTPYTKESEAMNAETSAVGRALWAAGIEARRGAASAEDVEKALVAEVDRELASRRPQQQQREPQARPITKGQLTKLAIVFGEAGIEEREQRLAIAAALVGREVASSKELTTREASQLIEVLVDVATNRRGWLTDEAGAVIGVSERVQPASTNGDDDADVSTGY